MLINFCGLRVNMQGTVLFSVVQSKNPALQAVWFFYAATTGYKPVVMKISPFRTNTRKIYVLE
jgi:hypothetical protein